MKYMMFVVADPVAAAEAEPSENDLTIDEWLAEVEGKRVTRRPGTPTATRSASRERARPNGDCWSAAWSKSAGDVCHRPLAGPSRPTVGANAGSTRRDSRFP